MSEQPDHDLDVCHCGDYRRDHKDGRGICIFSVDARGDGHSGAGACYEFRLSARYKREHWTTELARATGQD